MLERPISLSALRFIAILSVGLASACAGTSSTKPNDAPVAADPNVMWEDGARAVDTGEAMLTKGEKRLELGRQQILEGQAMIREGSERAEKAKLEYEQVKAGGSEAVDEQTQASTLREIGQRWETAIQDIKDGNNLVAKGNANISRGESEIREGQLLMETGSVLMRNAQRTRLSLRLLPLPTS